MIINHCTDIDWLRQAFQAAANHSDDPHTQNGAVLAPQSGFVSTSANHVPTGIAITASRLERPRKYGFIEHAERSAIYAAARCGTKTEGATLYCCWFACRDCARAIICAGIREVVGHVTPRSLTPGRWEDEVIAGEAMLREAGVAMRLTSAHGFRRVAFADPLYEMLEAFTGMHEELLRDRVTKEAVIGWIGKSPRHLLQTLGTEWGRKHVADDIWIKIALQRARQSACVAIPDVRFDNEAKAIRDAGGSVWLVERPAASCLDSSAAAHSSEQGVTGSLIDSVISNDGDMALLCDRVDSAVAKATIRYNG